MKDAGGGFGASVQLQSGLDKTCLQSIHAAGQRTLTSLFVMKTHLKSLKNRTRTTRFQCVFYISTINQHYSIHYKYTFLIQFIKSLNFYSTGKCFELQIIFFR